MIEYQLIQQRNRELRQQAYHDRLVREAAAARRAERLARRGPGVLDRLVRAVRDAAAGAARPRTRVHVREC